LDVEGACQFYENPDSQSGQKKYGVIFFSGDDSEYQINFEFS
jgi:hypothetical protein